MQFKQELEIRVLLNNLTTIVKTRLLGINDAIRGLTNKKIYTADERLFKEESLKQLKQYRRETNIILNKLMNFQKKEEIDSISILDLKEQFMKLDMNTGNNKDG